MSKKPDMNNLFFFRINDFLTGYLLEQCGKSQKTSESYRDGLTIFRRFITEEKKISLDRFQFSDLTRDLVLEFSEYLQKRYKASTCNQRLAALKSYVKYCADEDITLFQTAAMISRIPFVKEPSLLRPILTEEMMAAIIAAPKTGKNRLRDRVILIILYDTALREAEICNLTLGDIHLERGNSYLTIRGKGNKERYVAISANTEKHVETYLDKFHQSDRHDPNALFIYTNSRGVRGKMSTDNIQRIVKKYSEAVRSNFPDMPEHVHPHMIRRTRATHLYQDNVPLEMVGRILGHSSTETTKIYATPSVEMLRNSMESSFGIEEEEPLWEEEQDLLAKKFGLR